MYTLMFMFVLFPKVAPLKRDPNIGCRLGVLVFDMGCLLMETSITELSGNTLCFDAELTEHTGDLSQSSVTLGATESVSLLPKLYKILGICALWSLDGADMYE